MKIDINKVSVNLITKQGLLNSRSAKKVDAKELKIVALKNLKEVLSRLSFPEIYASK